MIVVKYCLVLFLCKTCTSWIDIDTPLDVRTIYRYHDKKELKLVMSDEFNTDGRRFNAGNDKIFEAVEKPDHTNEAIQFYNASPLFVTTADGKLKLMTRALKTSYYEWDPDNLKPQRYTKNYTSAMIQTWNKFCFTGGILEISIDLPGKSTSGGIWPAAWLMGNLARATFEATTMHMWPWSYDKCGQIDNLDAKQKISACNKKPGYGMHPSQGRGAPEIDIFEVMPGHEMPNRGVLKPFMSSSLQISPGIPVQKRPINGHPLNSSQIWYKNVTIGMNGEPNIWFWGQPCGPEKDISVNKIHKYMEDAISVNTGLNETHFDSQHVYRIEWQPGPNGYLYWYLDGETVLGIDGTSLEETTGAMIPMEPMYFILNTAVSHRWGMPEPCNAKTCKACWHCYDCMNPDCQCALPEGMKQCKNLPATMEMDFIRLYQDPDDELHTIGCNPINYPTKDFILSHKEIYQSWSPLSNWAINLYNFMTIFWLSLFCVCCTFGLWWVVNPIFKHEYSIRIIDSSHKLFRSSSYLRSANSSREGFSYSAINEST